ncbi:MAG: pilin [Patescibacteria group bacterium]
MKKISKHLMAFAIISLLVLPVFAVNAQTTDTFGIEQTNTALKGSLGASNTDPRTIAANIINLALGFLGIIAVCIVLFGGFKWMTAAGNEDKVEEAKKVLGAGVIGLLIVLAAWGLSSWVINQIFTNVLGGTGA